MSVDAKDFKQAMRQCAGAVALVTVGAEHGKRTGLTVTSACSLSDSPPSLIVCVNRNASAHARIREEGAFAINFLHEDHALLALTFSGQKGVNGDDRFAFGEWTRGETGAPVLTDAVAAFDCVLAQEFETKTHSIFVGEVRGVSHSDGGRAAGVSAQQLPRPSRNPRHRDGRRSRFAASELERFFVRPALRPFSPCGRRWAKRRGPPQFGEMAENPCPSAASRRAPSPQGRSVGDSYCASRSSALDLPIQRGAAEFQRARRFGHTTAMLAQRLDDRRTLGRFEIRLRPLPPNGGRSRSASVMTPSSAVQPASRSTWRSWRMLPG